jgi:hypothetical protein
MFFFEKKNQKTFIRLATVESGDTGFSTLHCCKADEEASFCSQKEDLR